MDVGSASPARGGVGWWWRSDADLLRAEYLYYYGELQVGLAVHGRGPTQASSLPPSPHSSRNRHPSTARVAVVAPAGLFRRAALSPIPILLPSSYDIAFRGFSLISPSWIVGLASDCSRFSVMLGSNVGSSSSRCLCLVSSCNVTVPLWVVRGAGATTRVSLSCVFTPTTGRQPSGC